MLTFEVENDLKNDTKTNQKCVKIEAEKNEKTTQTDALTTLEAASSEAWKGLQIPYLFHCQIIDNCVSQLWRLGFQKHPLKGAWKLLLVVCITGCLFN